MRLTLALAVLFAGCQCGRGGPDGGQGRVIEVVRLRNLFADTGKEDLPFELGEADLSALVTDDAGQRVVYPQITGAGTATFTQMPPGPFIISVSGYNLVTDEEHLDLSVASLGRASVALTDGGGTVLALDLTGLSPWQPYSDVLQLTSENAGYVAVNAQSYSGAQPDAGATSAAFPLAWWQACNTQRGQLAPLIDADAGDRAVLTQLVNAPVPDGGGLELRVLARAGTLPPLTMADHQTTAASVALTAPTGVEHVSLDYRQSEFDALRPQVHASAVANSSSVTLSVLPYTADEGAFTPAPDLAVLRPQELKGDVALAFDTGNPFNAGWPRLVTVRYAMAVDVQFPDGGSRAITTIIAVQDRLPSAGTTVLRPKVSPPRNVTVEGLPAAQRAQVPRRPLIAWEPPDKGSPTSYGVLVYRLARVGGGPVISLSEEVFYETTELSLRLPFGDVKPGAEYVFAVTAFDSPSAHVTQAPFKGGLPFASATALTALMRVDPSALNP